MEISKKEQNEIVGTISEKFKDTGAITYDYVLHFLEAIINEEPSYDEMNINNAAIAASTNAVMEIKYVIQNSIYTKLCKLSQDDIEVLLFLTEDKRSIANLILKKLGINDLTKIEDYLIDAFAAFEGDENFNTFITRFIMAKAKDKPFQTKTEMKLAEQRQKEQVVEEPKVKKKKKKKKDFVPKPEITTQEQIPIEQTAIEETVEEEHVLPSVVSTIEEIPKVHEELEEPQTTKEEINTYAECQKRCGKEKGNGTIDNLIKTAREINLISQMEKPENPLYEMYLLLRLGFINNSYYTKEEISVILSQPITDIIFYERNTWNIIKRMLNNKFNGYEEYLLTKKQPKVNN